jgi:anti-anti-sigma factor
MPNGVWGAGQFAPFTSILACGETSVTPSESPYRLEIANGCAELTLLPAMNEIEWGAIEKVGSDVLSSLASIKSPALIVNLSQLNYMGSAQVALVVRLWKATTAQDGRMVVVQQNEMIDEILTLAGLSKVWTIVETRAEALQELNVATSDGRRRRLMAFLVPFFVVLGLSTVAGIFLAEVEKTYWNVLIVLGLSLIAGVVIGLFSVSNFGKSGA